VAGCGLAAAASVDDDGSGRGAGTDLNGHLPTTEKKEEQEKLSFLKIC
jgi:hypothetical protein